MEATDVGSWSFVGSNVPEMNETTRIIASLDFVSAVHYVHV